MLTSAFGHVGPRRRVWFFKNYNSFLQELLSIKSVKYLVCLQVNEYLIDAVEKLQVANVVGLLKGKANPDSKNSAGFPILCCASFKVKFQQVILNSMQHLLLNYKCI